MGFLDHSTNNIIIDAVLTDKGRELLAKNDGSFRVVRYAFGDDEVDYSVIKKYGRTIGKEKIEKNTPVFEAQTMASMALRNPLASYSDANLVALPVLGLTSETATITAGTSGNLVVTLQLTIDDASITARQRGFLQESFFQVEVDSRFLYLTGKSARPGPGAHSAIYECGATPGEGSVLSNLTFTVAQSSAGSSETALQDASGNVITEIKVRGMSTGVTATEPIQVTVRYTV